MLGKSALEVKAHLPKGMCHLWRMPVSITETLAVNLKALMKASTEYRSQTAVGKKAHVNQRTVGRILRQEHSPSVSVLEAIAAVFKLEVWQLLTPGLDPDNPPVERLTRNESNALQEIRNAARSFSQIIPN